GRAVAGAATAAGAGAAAAGSDRSGVVADRTVAGVLAVRRGGADLPGHAGLAAARAAAGPPPPDDRDHGHHGAGERREEEHRADAHRHERYRPWSAARSSASAAGSTRSANSGWRSMYRATNGQRATTRRPAPRASSSAPRARRLPRPRP